MDYYREGESVGELAIIFGLAPRHIYRILKNKSGRYSKKHQKTTALLKMQQIQKKAIKWLEELEGF